MAITWIKIAHSKKYGGETYALKAKEAIKKHFDFKEIEIKSQEHTPRYFKLFDWFFKISKIKEYQDLWIFDSFIAVAFANFNTIKGKKAILIHHIDHSVFPLIVRPFFHFLEMIFHIKAKKADVIVTVSEYWKKYFLKKGYKKVQLIHNSFDEQDFNFSFEEIEQFKKKYNFDARAIVYIGNCLKAKGVVESYEALKGLNVNLVTSGERTVSIAARNLSLEYRDYLKLLKASSVVVTMSKFKEGWCGTAHEAMLCKTPVIGSGLGGMKELLEGGKQIICTDFKNLREKVEYLLRNHQARVKMGQDGFDFAREFTKEKFETSWFNVISDLTDEKL